MSDPTCKGSGLSTIASITGIVTFVSAISIGCFAYYRIVMGRTKRTFDLLNTFWSTKTQFNTFSDHIRQLTGQKVEGAQPNSPERRYLLRLIQMAGVLIQDINRLLFKLGTVVELDS